MSNRNKRRSLILDIGESARTSAEVFRSRSGNNASRASWNRDVGCTSCVNACAAVEQGSEYARDKRCPTETRTGSTRVDNWDGGMLVIGDISERKLCMLQNA
jgi:hypothetical protein